MVARQHNDILMRDVDENLQGPKLYLCAKFVYWTPGGQAGVCRQRNKHTEILCLILK